MMKQKSTDTKGCICITEITGEARGTKITGAGDPYGYCTVKIPDRQVRV